MERTDRKQYVSIWLGMEWFDVNSPEAEQDVLTELCGVAAYDIDSNEGNLSEGLELVPVKELLQPLSFSKSFIDEATAAAKKLGIEQARWVVVQYEFRYDRAKAVSPIASDPKFIGYFHYIVELPELPEPPK